MKKYIFGLISVLVIIIIWWLYSRYVDNVYILPGPVKVIQSLIKLLLQIDTYLIIITTLFRLILSLSIAFILGIILGVLSGNYISLDYFLHPFISMLRSIPIASVIVIVLILVGHQTSLYIIIFLMIFPIVYEATKQGVLNIDQSLKNALAIETNTRLKIMTSIQLPLAFPYIRTALFQSVGLGFKVIVMAEFIAQANRGIGRALFDGSLSINYESVFAWTMIIILIVILFEFILKRIKKVYDIS